jgi:cobalamin synthase
MNALLFSFLVLVYYLAEVASSVWCSFLFNCAVSLVWILSIVMMLLKPEPEAEQLNWLNIIVETRTKRLGCLMILIVSVFQLMSLMDWIHQDDICETQPSMKLTLISVTRNTFVSEKLIDALTAHN